MTGKHNVIERATGGIFPKGSQPRQYRSDQYRWKERAPIPDDGASSFSDSFSDTGSFSDTESGESSGEGGQLEDSGQEEQGNEHADEKVTAHSSIRVAVRLERGDSSVSAPAAGSENPELAQMVALLEQNGE